MIGAGTCAPTPCSEQPLHLCVRHARAVGGGEHDAGAGRRTAIPPRGSRLSTRVSKPCRRAQAGPYGARPATSVTPRAIYEKERLSAIQPGTRPQRRQPRGAHPDQKGRALVRLGTGRTPPDLRGRLAPHVHRSLLSPKIARRLHHSRDLGNPSISSPGSTTRRSTSAASMHCSPSCTRARNGPTESARSTSPSSRRARIRISSVSRWASAIGASMLKSSFARAIAPGGQPEGK